VRLERFVATHTLSLQQTLYAMATGAIEQDPSIVEVRLSMPNRHHFVVDLEPFGLDNPNEIFRVEDRPYGLIEAQILAESAPPGGPACDPYPLLSNAADRDRPRCRRTGVQNRRRRGTLGPCSCCRFSSSSTRITRSTAT
jgi:hypothetical protein